MPTSAPANSVDSNNQQRDTQLSTEQKALSINLDDSKYGTIVEIGAGQEVARQFFSVGAAAGTIAKTMSAYDMQISDDIYGKAQRYVSYERLQQMLTTEYGSLLARLQHVRAAETNFFAYAATVSARGYKKNKECHGWVGIQFQHSPNAEASTITLHVRMLDDENKLQSEALGILGVNLIHGAFNYLQQPLWIIECLLDNIGQNRIEVDLIHFSGPAFPEIENRLMNLHLIRAWLTRAVMFNADGHSIVPRNKLYKKPIMVMRGSFRPPNKVHVDMVNSGSRQFSALEQVDPDELVLLAEITMSELVSTGADDSDFLARVDLLNSLGYTVLLSDYVRFFRLRSWLRLYTQSPIGIILSVRDFNYLFDEEYYQGLEGGILEAMGKLFPDNTHVFVYPARDNGNLLTLDTVAVSERNQYLLKYLITNGLLQPAQHYVEENLHISAQQLIDDIQADRTGWEQALPDTVAEQIRRRKLFHLGQRDSLKQPDD